MKPVLIIVAVRMESAILERQLAHVSPAKASAFPYLEGTLAGLPVAISVGGPGKINAAAVTAAMIERIAPGMVINTGCAGAYPGSGLSIGDLVIATEEILADEGSITSSGWLDLQTMKLPYLNYNEQKYYNEIPLSKRLAEKAEIVAGRIGMTCKSGRCATVSTCSGSLKQGNELASRCNSISENMEGGAVALTCLRYGIDCLEVRGISNMVEERNIAAWDIKLAVETAQHFVLKYLEEIHQ